MVEIWASAPDVAHAGADIDPYAVARAPRRQFRGDARPGYAFEKPEQLVRNEAGARGINVAVALALGEKPLRDHEVEIVLGARHGDIEEAPLFLDLVRSAGAEVRRNTSIDDIQHEDRLPFLALGGMNCRKDQIILIEQR